MSISRYDRNPGTAFGMVSALVHRPGTSRFAARPVALSTLFGLGFLCALATLFGLRTTDAQAQISATLGNCLVGSLVVSPSVGSADNYLRGVAAIGPNDVWAVGHYVNASGINQTLTMHWDGAQWQVVPSPNVGSTGNYLYAVSASPSGEVWAVGHYIANTQRTLTIRWNGSQWNIVSSPNNGQLSNNLRGVSVVSPTDVWAVGFYFSNNNVDRTLTLHWNGSQWNLIPSPDIGQGTNRLFSVSAVSGGGAWAVGNYSPSSSGSFFTLAMQWDGAQWTIFSTPNPGGDYNLLIGVYSISLGDTWAVGFSTSGNNNSHHTLTAHWDGSEWSQVASPDSNLTENYLYSVTGTSSGDVWAAGYAYNLVGSAPSQAVGLHWDGTQWTLASSANSGTTTNTLFGVTAVFPGRAIAGGVSQSGSNNPLRTFSLLYTSDCSSPTATTTPAASPSSTSTEPSTATAISSPTATSTQPPVPTAHTFTPTQVSTHVESPTPTATASSAPTSCTIQFTDVPPGSTFYPFIQCLACQDIISGYSDGNFRPMNDVTRGQAAKIIANSASYEDPIPPERQTFNDVSPDSTFWVYIERVALHGAISGYECGGQSEPCPGRYFRPANNVTRGQLSKIDSEARGYDDLIPPDRRTFNDVLPGSTFWLNVERLALHNVISGYECGGTGEPCDAQNRPYFRPNASVTRGQASKVVANTFLPDCRTPAGK